MFVVLHAEVAAGLLDDLRHLGVVDVDDAREEVMLDLLVQLAEQVRAQWVAAVEI